MANLSFNVSDLPSSLPDSTTKLPSLAITTPPPPYTRGKENANVTDLSVKTPDPPFCHDAGGGSYSKTEEMVDLLVRFQEPDVDVNERREILEKCWEPLCSMIEKNRLSEELIPCVRDVVRPVLLQFEEADIKFLSSIVQLLVKTFHHFVEDSESIKSAYALLADLCESSDIDLQREVIEALEKLTALSSKSFLYVATQCIDSFWTSDKVSLQSVAYRLFTIIYPKIAGQNDKLHSFFHSYTNGARSTRPAIRKEVASTFPPILSELCRRLRVALDQERESSAAIAQTSGSGVTRVGSSNARERSQDLLTDLGELITLLTDLAKDDLASVRAQMARTLSANWQSILSTKDIMPDLFALLEESYDNLRVDGTVMVRFAYLKSLPSSDRPCNCVSTIQKILAFTQDPEPELRICALNLVFEIVATPTPETREVLSKLCVERESEILESLKLSLGKLVTDSNVSVRVCVAQSLIDLTDAFNIKYSIDALFPHYLTLLRDSVAHVKVEAVRALVISDIDRTSTTDCLAPDPSYSDSLPDKIIISIEDLRPAARHFLKGIQDPIGEEEAPVVTALLPLDESSWRSRQSSLVVVYLLLPLLSRGSRSFEKLWGTLVNSLKDAASSVRMLAAEAIARLSQVLSEEFVISFFKNEVKTALEKEDNYLHRIPLSKLITLSLVNLRCKVKEDPAVGDLFADLIGSLQADKSANVRLHVKRQLAGIDMSPSASAGGGLPDQIKRWILEAAKEEKAEQLKLVDEL